MSTASSKRPSAPFGSATSVVTDPPRRPDRAVQRFPRKALSSTPRSRRSIAMKAAPLARGLAGDGDTVWMGAADTSGLVVSYIQSVYLGVRLRLRAAAATGVR